MFYKIEEILKLKKITAYKVAKECGINPSLFSQWKSGRQKPSLNALTKIANYLETPIDYFLHEDNAKDMKDDKNIIGTINSGLQKDIKIKINGEDPRQLTEIEAELMRICKNLDIKGKHKLLDYAFKLEENK